MVVRISRSDARRLGLEADGRPRRKKAPAKMPAWQAEAAAELRATGCWHAIEFRHGRAWCLEDCELSRKR